MILNVDICKSILAKDVSDSYGRKLGKVVTFVTDSTKNVASIGIELNNGDFSYYCPSQISIEGNIVIIYYPWQIESEYLHDEYASILRRNSALSKLHDTGETPQEVYEEIRKQYDSTIKNLTERCQILADDLEEKIKVLNTQIDELKTFLTNIKIEYLVQNIDEKSYNASCLTVQNTLNRALSEKKDMESAINSISKNSTFTHVMQDFSPITNQAQPILLRIKEAES